MSTHDDDILDFDFFDEEATREDAPARERAPAASAAPWERRRRGRHAFARAG